MRRIVVFLSIVLVSVGAARAQNNTVVFDNQSGEPALVKLSGPTQTEVKVPNGAKVGANTSAGRYIIKVRYGTPGRYRYSKGEEFEVKGTATTRSKTTITLHKVVAGNYESTPISKDAFGARHAVQTRKGTLGAAFRNRTSQEKWRGGCMEMDTR